MYQHLRLQVRALKPPNNAFARITRTQTILTNKRTIISTSAAAATALGSKTKATLVWGGALSTFVIVSQHQRYTLTLLIVL